MKRFLILTLAIAALIAATALPAFAVETVVGKLCISYSNKYVGTKCVDVVARDVTAKEGKYEAFGFDYGAQWIGTGFSGLFFGVHNKDNRLYWKIGSYLPYMRMGDKITWTPTGGATQEFVVRGLQSLQTTQFNWDGAVREFEINKTPLVIQTCFGEYGYIKDLQRYDWSYRYFIIAEPAIKM